MDMQDEKSKSISSAESNYFVHFAMRYPVHNLEKKGSDENACT